MTLLRKPSPEPAPADEAGNRVSDGLIPLSHLALDMPEPQDGWAIFLGRRDVKFVGDDLGRDCITRHDARLLLDEQRAHQLQVAARARVAEAEAVEADQLRRRQIWGGIPVAVLPRNMSATEAMLQASAEDRPRRKNPVAAALDGEGLTFHSYAEEE